MATLVDGPPVAYEGSVLEAYYWHCQPASASEVLGVPAEQAPGFEGLPAYAYVMPWHEPHPEVLLKDREQWMQEEGEQYGRNLSLHDGLSLFGPVSQEKGEMEIERLRLLWQSMRRKGYQRHDGQSGDVEGWMLTEASGDWCILVRGGQHRTAVAAALGFDSIPVRLRLGPVKREEVMYWPQVTAGRIAVDGALAIFDRIMQGDPPRACQLAIGSPGSQVSSGSARYQASPSVHDG